MATVWSEKIANLRKAHGASPVKPSDTAARQTDESVLGSEKLANAEVALGGSIGMALLRRRRSQEALELMQQMATSPAQQEPVASPAVAKEQPTPAVAPRSVEPTPEVLTTASAVVAAKEELAAADKFSEWCIRVDYSLPFAQPPVTTPMADGENDGAVTSAPAEVAESAAVPMLPHRPVAFKGECIQTLMECHGSDAPINCIAVLPGGLLATGSDEAPVRVWDPTTGAECSQLGGFSGAVYSLAAHGPILAGGSDSAVLLWTIESWQFLRRLEGHSSYVWCLGMYMPPGGNDGPAYLVSGSADKSLRIWAVKPTGASADRPDADDPVDVLERHRDSVYSISGFPTRRALASGSADATIIVWTAVGQKIPRFTNGTTLRGHKKLVYSVVAVSDDYLASASEDWTVRMWDVESSSCLRVMANHQEAVTCLAALIDPGAGGAIAPAIFSAAKDCDIKVWSFADGVCIETLEGHRDEVLALEVLEASEDACVLASGCEDGSIKVWAVVRIEP